MEAGVVKCTTMLAGPEKRVESAEKHSTALESDEELKQNVTYLNKQAHSLCLLF